MCEVKEALNTWANTWPEVSTPDIPASDAVLTQ